MVSTKPSKNNWINFPTMDTTSSTVTSTNWDETTTTYISNSNSFYVTEEDIKKIKEIEKKRIKEVIKSTWEEKKKEFKKSENINIIPIPKVKNICLNGQGWR
ncbi:MAG: hypothetical protein PHF86_00170 [Candidatus Nanoarchaeia archaeon]|nr:hypothetical protein [Candidatus Nanoarchaeia archaeon]